MMARALLTSIITTSVSQLPSPKNRALRIVLQAVLIVTVTLLSALIGTILSAIFLNDVEL